MTIEEQLKALVGYEVVVHQYISEPDQIIGTLTEDEFGYSVTSKSSDGIKYNFIAAEVDYIQGVNIAIKLPLNDDNDDD